MLEPACATHWPACPAAACRRPGCFSILCIGLAGWQRVVMCRGWPWRPRWLSSSLAEDCALCCRAACSSPGLLSRVALCQRPLAAVQVASEQLCVLKCMQPPGCCSNWAPRFGGDPCSPQSSRQQRLAGAPLLLRFWQLAAWGTMGGPTGRVFKRCDPLGNTAGWVAASRLPQEAACPDKVRRARRSRRRPQGTP